MKLTRCLLIVWLGLNLAGSPISRAAGPSPEEKMHRLKWTLETFSESTRNSRKNVGWSLIGGGVGFLGAGLLLDARRGGLKDDTSAGHDSASGVAIALGIALPVAGALVLAMSTDLENDWQMQARKLEGLPLAEQIKGYEILFKERAEVDHDRRITGSSIGFAFAALGTGVYFASSRTVSNQAWLIFGGVNLGSALINHFKQSFREVEWNHYRDWAGGDSITSASHEIQDVGTVQFAVLPNPQGAGASLNYRF
ncbi:MAG: hypothetical protein H7222_18190 [Methylotenera sp.]|nr:hypothetical protein [Oligoflexia bacterium]